MKKFSNFIIKLRPYKRLYKIFWMSSIIILLFIFQIIMLLLSYAVPHQSGGFHYWTKGLHALLIDSRQEPNSAQGFIFAATIIGVIPIIPIVPFLYFTFANWYIQEKLSDKFIEVSKEKYLYWSKFIHFSGIAVLFILIPGLFSYLGGGGILPHQTYRAILGAFSDNFSHRVGGVSAFLYYGVGCVFGIIIIFWVFWMFLKWLGHQISKIWNRFKQYLETKREWRRTLKLEKLERKASIKKSKE